MLGFQPKSPATGVFVKIHQFLDIDVDDGSFGDGVCVDARWH